MDDHAFGKLADAVMARLFAILQDEDPDELDCDLAMGVLTMEFADGKKCVLNRQAAAHQLWLAEGATAWHFALDDAGRFVDTKGRGELTAVLGDVLSRRLGRRIELRKA
ncbi:MAG: iron donor protein CyaY [Planctomycetes bacterium]|nr:iron donor protein CyaY [Planctomycetota bacterium]